MKLIELTGPDEQKIAVNADQVRYVVYSDGNHVRVVFDAGHDVPVAEKYQDVLNKINAMQ